MSATPRNLLLAAALAVVASTASAATNAPTVTLAEQLANGSVTPAAFTQLVANSGLSASEAQDMTVDELLQIKFKDD